METGGLTFIIGNLTAGTTYNFKIKVRRKDSQLTTTSGTVKQTTYDYPYISNVEKTNLTIGDTQKLTVYNPLKRTVLIRMNKDNKNGLQFYEETIEDTSLTFTPNSDDLYASIPNSQSGNVVYTAIYGRSEKTTNGCTYKIKGDEQPTFEDFTYKDINTKVTNVTGNNQILVKGLSNLQVNIASSNKMIARNSASPKNYTAVIDTLNVNTDYSNEDIDLLVGTVLNNGSKRLTVTAYDTRILSTSINKDILIYDYRKPLINATVERLNNFEAESTLKINGTYTALKINDLAKNSIVSVNYRYRETNGEWSNWVSINTVSNNGEFTCKDTVLSLDNTKSFEFEIKVEDKFETISQLSGITLDVGQAIFFISSNKNMCIVNGEFLVNGNIQANNILNYEIVEEW